VLNLSANSATSLQSAIDTAIGNPELETEAIITVTANINLIADPLNPAEDYSLSVDWGTTTLTKLTILGDSSVNPKITLIDNPNGPTPLNVFTVTGTITSDKTMVFSNLGFDYSGPLVCVNGIKVVSGLNALRVTGCSFHTLDHGIYYCQDDDPNSADIVKDIEIDGCSFYKQEFNNFCLVPYDVSFTDSLVSMATISITNNQCSGYVASGDVSTHSQPINLDISNNSFEYSSSALYRGLYLIACNNASEFVIENNLFVNTGITIHGFNGVIKNNKFTTPDILPHYLIVLWSVQDVTSEFIIQNNQFYGCFDYAIQLYHIGSVAASLINNSFFGAGGVLEISTLTPYLNDANIVPIFANNLIACTGVKFSVTVGYGTQVTLTEPILLENSFFQPAYPTANMSSFTIDYDTCDYGDPFIELDENNHTYTSIWTYTDRSPLINKGRSVPQIGLETDPDGTPPDIGARYYPHFNRTYDFSRSPFTGSNIFWMSFPVIDDRSHEGEQHYDMLGYLFEEQMEYAPTFNQLNSASWSYNLDFDNMHYDNVQHLWDNDDKEVTQPQGFKLKFNDGDISPIVVNGFKVDHETTPVELAINTGDNLPFDNWIGYYVPDVQLAGVALSRLLPNSQNETYLDHIYRIKAQYWSTERISPEYGSRWIVDPNHYTLSEGDMISIFLLPNAPKSLYWNTPHISVDPRIRELPVNFTYKEELDYTPIFIEFDPNDLPQEVGLYVSGVCKGAAVVDSSLIEVNYYGTEAKSGDEIEVMFYYGDKGMKKAPAAYVYNPETLLFEAGSLKASNLGDYGYLSFNRGEGSSLVPLVTELKQNYPNPFKAQTNISWILAKDAPVSVDIYNLRGQKVKTLFSGLGQKGRQSLAWDATDLHGNKVASGVYFWRLSTPETTKVQKMLVLK